jgi:hypothetical protein
MRMRVGDPLAPDARVAHTESASRNGSRVGQWLLTFILLARTVGFGAACGGPNPAGTLGGACEEGSSCGSGAVCDPGLECNFATNTCRKASPPPGLVTSCDGSCHEDPSIACKPGQQGFNCCAGGAAESDRCTAKGKATYCCDVDPPCIVKQGECGGPPATSYECIGVAQPDVGVSGCLRGSYGVVQWYCCAPSDSCIDVPNRGGILYPCGAGEPVVVCAGSATPQAPGITCSPSGNPHEGYVVETYCCSSDDGSVDAAPGDDGGLDGATE